MPEPNEQIASLRHLLSETSLPPVPKHRRTTGRDIIEALMPDIRAAMKRGHTLHQVLEKLRREGGLELRESTIRGYMYGKLRRGSGVQPARKHLTQAHPDRKAS